jgi:hypothetical protein
MTEHDVTPAPAANRHKLGLFSMNIERAVNISISTLD